MAYYQILYSSDGNDYEKEFENPEDILLLDNIDNIYYVSKIYFKQHPNGSLDKKPFNITLYTSDCPETPDSYIINYTVVSKMYGINALNTTDIEIIKKFNMH